MKRISFHIPIPVCWAVAVLTASGCCPCRHLSTDTRDSVRVETVTVTTERIDTVTVELPVEVYRNVTRDTISTIRGSYASTTAEIRDGFLFHTLDCRGDVPVVVKEVETVRDSIVYRDRVQTKVVEVAKPPTRWQRWQRNAFWWLLAIVAVYAAARVGIRILKK